MTEKARRLLALLGILPDGIRREDLGQLLPPDGVDAAATLRQVGGLTFDEGRRLRVLAPVRDYLAANHAPRPEDRERAIGFYCQVAGTEGSKAGRAGGAEAIVRVAAETGNLVTMLRAGLTAPDPEPALRGACGLGNFGCFSGIDLSAILSEAEQAASARGNTRRSADLIEILGHIALDHSEHGEARRRYEEALPLYAQVGAVRGQAVCVERLGDIALERSEYGEAQRRYEEALSLYAQVGDVLGQANCVLSLGAIAKARREYGGALQRYEEARSLFLQVADTRGQANCVYSLAGIALDHSEHGEARRRYEEALPLYAQVGDILGQANCVLDLGDIAKAEENLSCAKEGYEQALALYERLGEPYSIGRAHVWLARITEADEQRRHVQAARDAWTRIDRPDLVAILDREFGG
jgi:tetratricopeptide (TPR) repeat protein